MRAAGAGGGEQGDCEADGGDTEGGPEDVGGLEDDGVGLEEEAAGHLDEAEVLLHEGECHADEEPGGEPDQGDQPTLPDKDPSNEAVVGAEGPQRLHVAALGDGQHRQGAEDVRRDNYHYKQQYQIDSQLLVAHHLVQSRLLLDPILHQEVRA